MDKVFIKAKICELISSSYLKQICVDSSCRCGKNIMHHFSILYASMVFETLSDMVDQGEIDVFRPNNLATFSNSCLVCLFIEAI